MTFPRAHLARSAGLLAALLLAGCATSMHSLTMSIPATGETLSGALSIGSGPRDVTLTADNGQLACNGVSLIEYATLGCSTSGALRLQCTDGRDVTGHWAMEDCGSGQGSGEDDLGNAVAFAIGTAAVDVKPVAVTPPAPRARDGRDARQHDARLFDIGGGHAVAFGDARDHDIVFTDAETHLAIVKRDGREMRPMVLSGESLRAGEEAFVVTPARVERIRIEGEEPDWKIAGDIALPAGLPVMNPEGEVIALTNGAGLVTARTLRRYLRMVAPALADEPATPVNAEALRARMNVD